MTVVRTLRGLVDDNFVIICQVGEILAIYMGMNQKLHPK